MTSTTPMKVNTIKENLDYYVVIIVRKSIIFPLGFDKYLINNSQYIDGFTQDLAVEGPSLHALTAASSFNLISKFTCLKTCR
jgi:hypothetical protein